MDVSKQWCKEFYRLREKVFYNIKAVSDLEDFPYNPNNVDYAEINNSSVKEYIFLKDREKVIPS